MTSTIFTIGFTKKSAEEFFRLLQEAQVRKLIDIRENRVGQLAGFAKYPDLAFFLDRVAGIAYSYQPVFAPSPEIRDAYRKTRDWMQFEKSFLKLMRQRRVLEAVDPSLFEGKVALLCSEAEAEKCPRSLVAEMLAQHWLSQGHAVEVRHLQSSKRGPGEGFLPWPSKVVERVAQASCFSFCGPKPPGDGSKLAAFPVANL